MTVLVYAEMYFYICKYKDVRKELDLSLQITRTNTLDVY